MIWIHVVIAVLWKCAAATTRRWSEGTCRSDQNCVIPLGETWILDESSRVKDLTIHGELQWDTSSPSLELTAARIMLEGGTFRIGTPSSPMLLPATVRLAENEAGLSDHSFFASRYLAGEGGLISIHGAPKTTWALLAKSIHVGDRSIFIHDVEDVEKEMNWAVGDVIGIATTTRSKSTKHKIVSFGRNGEVQLDSAVTNNHFGGLVDVGPKWPAVEIRAEVVNLSRNVVITMDDQEFKRSKKGLHINMANSGVLDISYARIENCGQDRVVGKYCVHMHLLRQCPLCRVEGLAIEDTENVGVTVHGTHEATISKNVIWDARSVGIYVEDGNEMNNSFDDNVLICSYYRDGAADGETNECFKFGEHNAGFYVIGMTNNFRRNRIVGYNQGIFTPGGSMGNGVAYGKVCPRHHPLLDFVGNVNHDCERFGIYLDNQYPRQVARDEDGYVSDMSTCDEFKPDGSDNGHFNVILDSLEYNNNFVGQYTLGDIQFRNFVSINNLHGMYWKESKNFADGVSSHVKDSIFAKADMDGWTHGSGPTFLGPSGPFTFIMENVVLHGEMSGDWCSLCAGQHCGLPHFNDGLPGSLCSAQYLLDKVDLSGVVPTHGRYVGFGVSGGDGLSVTFSAFDGSLGGQPGVPRTLVNGAMSGYDRIKDCEQLGDEWDNAFACPFAVRRLTFKTSDMGDGMYLSGPGFDNAARSNVDADPVHARDGGRLIYDKVKRGYGTIVVAGETYGVEGMPFPVDVEFSDVALGERFPADKPIKLEIAGQGTCEFSAGADPFTECEEWQRPADVIDLDVEDVDWADGSFRTEKKFNGSPSIRWSNWRSAAVQVVEVTWGSGTRWWQKPTIRYRSSEADTWIEKSLDGSAEALDRIDLAGARVREFEIRGGGSGSVVEITLRGAWASPEGFKEMQRISERGRTIDQWFASRAGPEFGPYECMERCARTAECESVSFTKDYLCELKDKCVDPDVDEISNRHDWIRYTFFRTGCRDGAHSEPVPLPVPTPSALPVQPTPAEPAPVPACGSAMGSIDPCVEHVNWAVTVGKISFPQFYPDFESITGTSLSSATFDDIQTYFYCSDVDKKFKCATPVCGRPCGKDPQIDCGDSSGLDCLADIEWALRNGRVQNPQWYPGFEDITGVALFKANADDFQMYFYCSDDHSGKSHDCGKPVCGRACPSRAF